MLKKPTSQINFKGNNHTFKGTIVRLGGRNILNIIKQITIQKTSWGKVDAKGGGLAPS